MDRVNIKRAPVDQCIANTERHNTSVVARRLRISLRRFSLR